MPSKLVTIDDAITSSQFQHGGQTLNQLVLLLSGSSLDAEEDIRINTTFKFYSGKFAMYDNDALRTHKVFLKVENITSGNDKSITIRSPTIQDDFLVTESQNQVLNNKTLTTNILFGADVSANNKGLVKLNNITWGNNVGTEPTSTTTELPIFRKDLDANNQAVYISKIENGAVIKVRVC